MWRNELLQIASENMKYFGHHQTICQIFICSSLCTCVVRGTEGKCVLMSTVEEDQSCCVDTWNRTRVSERQVLSTAKPPLQPLGSVILNTEYKTIVYQGNMCT